MTYRQLETPPLVSFVGEHLVAFDAERGTILWSLEPPVRPGRVLCAGGSVFIATTGPEVRAHSSIAVHDLATGALRGTMAAGFEVTAAIARADRLYFAGDGGVLVLATSGALVWRATVTKTQSGGVFGDDTYEVIACDATGRETGRVRVRRPGANTFLALGDVVAQRDFDT